MQSSSFYFACTLSLDSLLDKSRRALKGHKEYHSIVPLEGPEGVWTYDERPPPVRTHPHTRLYKAVARASPPCVRACVHHGVACTNQYCTNCAEQTTCVSASTRDGCSGAWSRRPPPRTPICKGYVVAVKIFRPAARRLLCSHAETSVLSMRDTASACSRCPPPSWSAASDLDGRMAR